jgi:hypothetical protein
LEASDLSAQGSTVHELLEHIFAQRPRLRSYVVDDQGGLRHHVCIFIDGEQIHDRRGLGDVVRDDSIIDVIQALSGG